MKRIISNWHSVIGLVGLALLAIATQAASDQDEYQKYWPQWRGPLGNGVAPKSDAPLSFSATKNVKWKVEIPGRGFSSPIVWRDRIFVTSAVPLEDPAPPAGGQRRVGMKVVSHRFEVLCIERKTGKVLWERTAQEALPHEGYHPQLSSFANHSPITDGEKVYAFFGSSGLYCYDLNGKLEWSRDFGVQMKMFNHFGESSSPALHGNTLVLLFDHDGQSFIEAVDKRSGKTLWRTLREEQTSWSSPYILVHEGKAQVVASGGNFVSSYDLASGEVIWKCAGMTPHPIPTPVSGFGLLFANSGTKERSIRVIRLGRSGNLTDSDAIAWEFNKGASYNPSPLLWGDELYLIRDGGLNRGTSQFSCFDAKTGAQHFLQERLRTDEIKASPVGAGDKIYLCTEDGDVLVLKRGKTLEILAINPMEEMFLASPAVVEGELFLRGIKHLFCISDQSLKK